MKRVSINLCVFLMAFLMVAPSLATGLKGEVAVNQTSDTAAKAKTEAINSARRQVLTNVLSQYSSRESLVDLIEKSSDEDLINLISSTSVSSEQMSTTGYSAKIQMNIDNDAVKKWLDSNEISNWVPLTETNERFTTLIVISNGIQDWAELKRITREDNIEIETESFTGNQIVAKMPLTYRTKFTAAVRGAGWKYSDNDGVLHIWK